MSPYVILLTCYSFEIVIWLVDKMYILQFVVWYMGVFYHALCACSHSMCTDYVPHVYHGEFPVLSSFPFCFISVNDFHSKLISIDGKETEINLRITVKNGVKRSHYETTLLFLFIISSELFS